MSNLRRIQVRVIIKKVKYYLNTYSTAGMDISWFQKLISQLEIHGEVISREDANLKLLRSLPSAWNNFALIVRNKSDLDTLSMDDLYNNLKVYKSEIKGQSISSLNTQNVAFVSQITLAALMKQLILLIVILLLVLRINLLLHHMLTMSYFFFTNQSNTPQLDNEDLEQIDADDLEEMDHKWQVAMLTIRVKRFIKKTERKLNLNVKETVGFDRTKVKCYNYHRRGHFAKECRAPRNQGNKNKDAPRRNALVDTSTPNTLVVQDGICGYDWTFQAKEGLTNFALMAYTSQGSSSSSSSDSKDAKFLWEEIKNRFQKLISQLEIHGEVISREDANLKLLRSLPSAWNNFALIVRNKSDLDTLSMDDLYNNLKVYKSEIKGQSISSLNTQNVAFVSQITLAALMKQLILLIVILLLVLRINLLLHHMLTMSYFFFTNQSNTPQLDNEDLEQIDADDLEEMDHKWQVAMLTIRVKRFIKKTERKLNLNGKETVGFDRTKVKCYNYHRRGHFAKECRAPRNQGNKNKDAPRRNALVDTSTPNTLVVQDGICGYDWTFQAKEGLTNFALMAYTSQGYQMGLESLEARTVVHEKNEAVYEEDIAFLKYDVQVKDISIKELKNQLENVLKEKDDLKLKLENFETSSKNLTKLINSQISAKDKTDLGYDCKMNESDLNNIHVNESEVLDNVFDSVFDSHRSDGMIIKADLSLVGLDDSVFKTKVSETIISVPKIKTNASKISKNSLEKPKTVRSSAPLIEEWELDSKDENLFKPKELKKIVKPSFEKIKFVNARNTTVKNESKAEKPRKFSQSPRVSAARRVNTAAPRQNMNDALPITYSYFKAHSPLRRPFNQKSAAKTNNFNEKVNTARVNNVTTAGLKAVFSVAEENRDNDIIKKLMLDLLHLEEMLNEKNNVLFTDIECVVLSPDFKLLDKSQVLLKVPRNNNMYSFDLKNVVPLGGLTCLFAKATLDESNLWHRRLGHINFKTMNKLVRGNLVRGLPSKLFENDHTCVACQKGKQHKSSCKTKTGIRKEFSVARTIRQNSVAKRTNKTLIEAAKTMIEDSKLPTTSEAVNTACYVQNKVLVIKPHNKTPYKLFLGRKPALSFMRPFGCHVTILNTLDHLGTGPNWMFNIDTLTMSMNYQPIFARNQTNGNAGPKSSEDEVADDAGKKSTEVPRKENRVQDPAKEDDEVKGAVADFNNLELTTVVNPIPTTRIHKDHPKEQIIGDPLSAPQTRRMTHTSQEHAMVSYIKKQRITNHKDYQNCLFACFLSQIEPKKVIQALTDLSWIEAMQDELLQFRLQKVWRLVVLPKDKHAIETKWVYRNKKDERGIVVRNKARLVIQGHTQEEGIDYDKVFDPIGRIEAIRLFLAYASFIGFIVYQIDLKSAILYGIIEEEVYVCQPPSFEDPQFPDKVNKVMQRDDGIFISQDTYVADILKKFGFSSVKTTSTLIETNKASLKDEEAKGMDVHLYKSMIRSLMHLTTSRPDIMFDDCTCARFQVTPKVSHLHVAKRIFRYLKGQPKLGLWYPRDLPFDLEAFLDSDYARSSLDRKSTIEGCLFLRKRLIS
nr:retrovirus-related Pol polyprotein from transposon TNT 1-94 [Tanacetum cinerariifolium]